MTDNTNQEKIEVVEVTDVTTDLTEELRPEYVTEELYDALGDTVTIVATGGVIEYRKPNGEVDKKRYLQVQFPGDDHIYKAKLTYKQLDECAKEFGSKDITKWLGKQLRLTGDTYAGNWYAKYSPVKLGKRAATKAQAPVTEAEAEQVIEDLESIDGGESDEE